MRGHSVTWSGEDHDHDDITSSSIVHSKYIYRSDPEERLTNVPWQLSPRGAGFLFGARVTDEFCHVNRLDLIARAHQLVMEGKQYHFPNKNLVTIWSGKNAKMMRLPWHFF